MEFDSISFLLYKILIKQRNTINDYFFRIPLNKLNVEVLLSWSFKNIARFNDFSGTQVTFDITFLAFKCSCLV